MKEELIKLSEEKGFESGLLKTCCADEWFHLWCCDLQKWLREENLIHIEVIPNEEQWHTVMYPLICIDDAGHYGDHKTFELALERGLIEGLKLI